MRPPLIILVCLAMSGLLGTAAQTTTDDAEITVAAHSPPRAGTVAAFPIELPPSPTTTAAPPATTDPPPKVTTTTRVRTTTSRSSRRAPSTLPATTTTLAAVVTTVLEDAERVAAAFEEEPDPAEVAEPLIPDGCVTRAAKTFQGMIDCWTGVVTQYPWPSLAKVWRVMWCESKGNPFARNPSGATGLMQIMHGPIDPVANIERAWHMSRHGTNWRPWVCK